MKLLNSVFRYFFVVVAAAAAVQAAATISDDVPDKEDVDCQASGSAMSFEGTCDSRNHTFTSQCKVEEQDKDDGMGGTIVECFVEENDCGCLYWQNDAVNGFVAGLEKDSDKCNACFVHGYTPEISDDVPVETTTCQASGSAMSFQGSCRSRNHTFTSQCQLDEKGGECKVSEKECGCLYWQNDAVDGFVSGLEANSNKCDACNVHGYEAKESGAATYYVQKFVIGFFLLSATAALMILE